MGVFEKSGVKSAFPEKKGKCRNKVQDEDNLH
jgi:hypothetical protein